MAHFSACRDFHSSRRLGRREVLRAGALSWFGLNLPRWFDARVVAAEPRESRTFGRAKSCILLFMWGGPAHQDTWDLKPNAPSEIRGEFKPISTRVPGIQICEHLPRLAKRVDRLAIVRSMTHTDVNHTTATHFLLTGQPPPAASDMRQDWPHVGAVYARTRQPAGCLPPLVQMRPKVPGDVPRFVEESHGQSGGWLGPDFDPFTIDADPSRDDYHVGDFALAGDLSIERLDDRRQLLSHIDRWLRGQDEGSFGVVDGNYRRAFELLASAVGRRAFRLDDEPRAVRERYGFNPHGQSVLQARRLVERGVPLVTVFWPNDGIKNVSVYWDTHSRNFVDLRERLMPVADQAFSALLDDLADRALLDETLVAWTGEFGRTPRVGQRNSDAGAGADGRDHWPGCFTSVLAGARIRGGQVYGTSDRFAAYPASNPVAPVDLMATVYHYLGLPQDLTIRDRQGRPMIMCAGRPIPELVS